MLLMDCLSTYSAIALLIGYPGTQLAKDGLAIAMYLEKRKVPSALDEKLRQTGQLKVVPSELSAVRKYRCSKPTDGTVRIISSVVKSMHLLMK